MSENLSDASDLYHKARALMDKNSLEEAIILFQNSAELDPHFKTLELLGECYIRLNRLREAIIPLAAAVGLNKGVRAASLLAEVFLNLKDYDKAKEMAEIALSQEPNNKKAIEVNKIVVTDSDWQKRNG
jgi:tetratricopeptide (TPR) repeat protein